MNTQSPFQPYRQDLSLKRRGPSHTHAPMGISGSQAPFQAPFEGGDPECYSKAALQLAWDKLYRARAILEAEVAHVRDDRLALRAEIEALAEREQAVAAREEFVRRQQMQVALEQEEAAEKESGSKLTRLTRAPFEMARSVFGTKK
jgi:hypothetical protein